MSTKTNVPSWKMDNLFVEKISLLILSCLRVSEKTTSKHNNPVDLWFFVTIKSWHSDTWSNFYDEFLPRQPRFSSGFVWIMLQEFLLLVEWSIKFVVDSRSFLKRKNAIEEGWLVTQRYLSAPFCRVTAINNDAAIPSKSLMRVQFYHHQLETAKRTWFYCCYSSSNLSHKQVTFW